MMPGGLPTGAASTSLWVIFRMRQVWGPKAKGLAHAPFPDELFVQLTDFGPCLPQSQIEISPIGNGAAGHIDEHQGTGFGPDGVVYAVQ